MIYRMANAQETRKERRAAAREEREEAERRDAAAATRKRRLIQLGGLVALAAVVVVVAIVISSGGSKQPTKQAGEPIAGANLAAEEFDGIAQKGDSLGDPNAPATLIEYGDLVCPACAAYSNDVLPPLIEKYVRTGKLRMESRMFQFVRPYSLEAAQYSHAAGLQNKQWNFDRVWYINQGDEGVDYVDEAFARKIASGVPGLDADKLIADSKTAAVKDAAVKDQQEFEALGFDSTPSFAGGKTGGTMKPVDLSQDPDKAVADLIASAGGSS